MNNRTMEEQMEDRLWDYIDGLASAEEHAAVGALIAANRDWMEKYRELLVLHRTISGMGLEEPPMRFTLNVMDEIARHQVAPATNSYINKYIVRGIAALFLTLILGMLIWCLGQFHWSSGGTTGSSLLSQYSQDLRHGLQDRLDKFEWSKLFSSTWLYVFLLINIVIGFVLLDTYLQKRRRQFTEQ